MPLSRVWCRYLLDEGRHRRTAGGVGRILQMEGGRGLDLHDMQAGIDDSGDGRACVRERNGQVAGVEADADVLRIEQGDARLEP
jgi:hypothetical protein